MKLNFRRIINTIKSSSLAEGLYRSHHHHQHRNKNTLEKRPRMVLLLQEEIPKLQFVFIKTCH